MSTTSNETRTDWETVIGLEIHTELKTQTKLFCSCANNFGSEPNSNICAVCLGLPGSLPVINRQAVELAMRIGTALNCSIETSVMSRKNYFYPDMPKDYQVSQFDLPINVDGHLEINDGSTVGIERAHLEEDTGKNTHIGGRGRIQDAEYSLIDYNRAGIPLVEIVSRPDMRSAEQAKAYVSEVRAILVAIGASDGKMEEGSLRVDANVSVRKPGEEFGTRCEIKNVNSIRSLGRAIEYEARRQIELIEAGDKVEQQTRHWSENDGRTHFGRIKSDADDYRYFPEPDLVPIAPDEAWKQTVRDNLAMLPAARRQRLFDLDASANADTVATIVDAELDELVIDIVNNGADAKLAINRTANSLVTDVDAAKSIGAATLAKTFAMETDAKLTATQAKTVIAELLENGGGDPQQIADKHGFEPVDNDALSATVNEIVAAHSDELERLKGGEQKLMGFFVGKVMAATQGKADGKAVQALLREHMK